jgi:uncharacterized phage protein gp47/JayE
MPFERPTLDALIARILTDLETNLPGVDARLRRSVENALGKALGGATHELHGYLLWLSRQLFPETAERAFLARYGGRYGLTFKAPVAAVGNFTIGGTNGTICTAGSLWQRGDGTVYVQGPAVTIAGGTGTISLTAQLAGAGGNAELGVVLSLVTPIAGINPTGTVATGGLVGGLDEESESDFLTRLLQRMQNVPKGGGPGDYVRWALEVPGVTKAWERAAWLGLGTVGVSFLVDDAIPNGTKVTEVQTYIDARRPLTAAVTVFAPTAVALPYTIAPTPNTAAVQAAITAQLTDFHRREAELGGTLYLSRINAAIAAAIGLDHHTLTLPAANATAAANELRTLGAITYV